MIGILIATHGGFAEGLLDAVELIAGKQEKVATMGLRHGDSIDGFEATMAEHIEALDDGDGVMILVDIVGGSPANCALKSMRLGNKINAIAGVNMPMVVDAVFSRLGATLDQLCEACQSAYGDGLVLLHKEFETLMASATEDDDEF